MHILMTVNAAWNILTILTDNGKEFTDRLFGLCFGVQN